MEHNIPGVNVINALIDIYNTITTWPVLSGSFAIIVLLTFMRGK